jgi:hypothetical protein
MSSLRRIKEDVEEVAEGVECGLGAEGFTDWKEGDKLECYTVSDSDFSAALMDTDSCITSHRLACIRLKGGQRV